MTSILDTWQLGEWVDTSIDPSTPCLSHLEPAISRGMSASAHEETLRIVKDLAFGSVRLFFHML